ncbi:MAG: hypothetical protein QHH43_07655 [Candidatus Saccharicenans sp.]|jgi:hypothetical protein|nr:hypothetical protein [Candidatus Saccharicenans sp.]MDH7575612.1 hypothetical protein [Candidatus Saccharicenans sp.]
MSKKPGIGKLGAGIFLMVLFLSGSLLAQPRKYQVITSEVRLHLEPSDRSPVVVSAPRGAILAQASAVRFRHNWIFVYYYHPEKQKTLAGYVWEPPLRKLFPTVNARLIYNGESVAEPGELDFSQELKFAYFWGMPPQKLLEVEGEPLGVDRSDGQEVYQYQREIMNRRCLVEYVFIQGELTAARFFMMDTFTDNNYYINDFVKAKNYLVQRFGLPVDDQTVWYDSTFQERQEFWGRALGSGLVEFRSSWVIGETEVELVLTGSDNRVAFMAECVGQRYKSFFSH